MSFLKDILTPDNTEEIKPNLFVQRVRKGYRVINPIAWKGKIRWKEQLLSILSFRVIIGLTIILFVAWSYYHDVSALTDFRNSIVENPRAFCDRLDSYLLTGGCTPYLESQGICHMNLSTNIEVIDGEDS